MHKKFVLRSRVESREGVTRIAALEAEVERLMALAKSTEEELRSRRLGALYSCGFSSVTQK